MPRLPFSMFLPRLAAILLAAGTPALSLAQDETPELTQAAAQYRKDVEFATKPIRDRYLSRLDSLKRQLGARGDARGAVAVQEEADRVLAAIPDETVATAGAKLAGTWKINYVNGDSRTYVISPDGSASFLSFDPMGRQNGATRKKLSVRSGDVLVEFQEGAIERLKIAGGKLQVEHFNPKTQYPKGQPATRGTGVPAAARRD